MVAVSCAMGVVTPVASIEACSTQADESTGVLLEAKLLWGRDTMAVRHLRPGAEVRVRDLRLDVPGAEIVVAGRDESGAFVLRLPNGVIVPPGCRMTLRMGRATLRLALVADDIVRLPRAIPDGRAAFGILVAAALHLVLLGLVAHGRPDQGLAEEEARVTMQRMVAAAEDRALAELAAVQQRAREEQNPGALASAHEQAAAGNPANTQELAARARITRGEDHHAAKSSAPASEARSTQDEVATFGILSLLAGDHAGQAGNSAFAAESGPAAMGNIFGQTIHDAAGLGGLGLTGSGHGGGGRGAGVSLGAIGTIGHSGGAGDGQGFGSSGRVAGSHTVRSWIMSGGGGVQVNGRLPAEAIQRVVRQSFGRLRGCYEAGLLRNPDLEGRISVKFVIDRDGNVALASGANRTLDDASVASCVVKAYEAMSFPRPTGGIVYVVYPVVFTRT